MDCVFQEGMDGTLPVLNKWGRATAQISGWQTTGVICFSRSVLRRNAAHKKIMLHARLNTTDLFNRITDHRRKKIHHPEIELSMKDQGVLTKHFLTHTCYSETGILGFKDAQSVQNAALKRLSSFLAKFTCNCDGQQ